MRQSLPERDDDVDSDVPYLARRTDDKPTAMPSWSWLVLGLLCLLGLGSLYAIYSMIELAIDVFR